MKESTTQAERNEASPTLIEIADEAMAITPEARMMRFWAGDTKTNRLVIPKKILLYLEVEIEEPPTLALEVEIEEPPTLALEVEIEEPPTLALPVEIER